MNEIVAVIPAAGSGTRMLPFTLASPKELYPINKKAVIEHVIEGIHNYMEINKIFVIVSEHKGAVMDYLGNGSRLNKGCLNLAYLFQEERKGLAHAIYQAKPWVRNDFVVFAADTFIEPKNELTKLTKFHQENNNLVTILVKEVKDPTPYGIIKFDKNYNLIDAIEKPTMEQAKPFMNSNGMYYSVIPIYMFGTKIFEYIEKTNPGHKGELQITDSIILAHNNGEKIQTIPIEGQCMDCGNWNEIDNVEKYFKNINKEEERGNLL